MFLVLEAFFLVPDFAGGIVNCPEAIHILRLAIKLNGEQATVGARSKF